jgi:hypothetical protein
MKPRTPASAAAGVGFLRGRPASGSATLAAVMAALAADLRLGVN